jgi:carboxymethylenebutenolidase
MTAATGLAATSVASAAGHLHVVEKDVTIQTADGACDAAFFHPASGAHAGVLIWTDIFGLRPTFRDFGRRLAGDGYAVLVPNPFYRTAKAPVFARSRRRSISRIRTSGPNFNSSRGRSTQRARSSATPRRISASWIRSRR